eukprot:scaffold285_cov330-Pavlova_lutheri.AAC.123
MENPSLFICDLSFCRRVLRACQILQDVVSIPSFQWISNKKGGAALIVGWAPKDLPDIAPDLHVPTRRPDLPRIVSDFEIVLRGSRIPSRPLPVLCRPRLPSPHSARRTSVEPTPLGPCAVEDRISRAPGWESTWRWTSIFRHSPGGMATHSAHATSSRRASSPSGVVCRRGRRCRTARRGVGVCRAGTMEEQAKAFADAERRWEESEAQARAEEAVHGLTGREADPARTRETRVFEGVPEAARGRVDGAGRASAGRSEQSGGEGHDQGASVRGGRRSEPRRSAEAGVCLRHGRLVVGWQAHEAQRHLRVAGAEAAGPGPAGDRVLPERTAILVGVRAAG